MKKTYEKIELKIISLGNDDVITESDNVVDMPEFPEFFEKD